jgi:hypothetical protein
VGTAKVVLHPNWPCPVALVQAPTANSGVVDIGNETLQNIRIVKGNDPVAIYPSNLNLWYAKSTANGDKLNILAYYFPVG